MKNRHLLSALILASLALFSSTAFARKPAVEPVMGVSIDDYNDVPPSEAKAYDWNANKADAISAPAAPVQIKKMESQPLQKSQLAQKNPVEEETSSNSTYFLLGLLAALPFVLWFGIMKGLPEQEIAETIEFPTSQKDEDDDIHYPKAS